MKNIKLLAILGIAFFASNAMSAQVSLGIDIRLPSVVVSGQYDTGYEVQRRKVVYHDEPVVYVDRRARDYDRWHEERRYERRKCEEKRHYHGKDCYKKYKEKDYKRYNKGNRYDD
ncbi:hypothetical protein ACMDB5_07330 [Flavobacterium sp. W1B]|uniref:hypothetical protein n=1 Tax=Flavobacterium sp. W1B TaxID=3394146 RepID=UPI0039BCBC61